MARDGERVTTAELIDRFDIALVPREPVTYDLLTEGGRR